MPSSLLQSGAIFTVANILSAAMPFFLIPILTRAMSPHEYGEVVAFYMLVSLSSCIAGLGLQGAVSVKWFSRADAEDKRQYTGSALFAVIISVVVAGILFGLIAPRTGIPLAPLFCGLAAVCAGGITVQSIRFSVYQAQGKPFKAAILQVGSSVLNVSLSLIAVLYMQLGAEGRIGAATTASILVVVGSVFTLLRNNDASYRPNEAHMRALLGFGIPLVPHVLAGALLGNVDRLAVSSVLDSSDLGIYGAAAQLGLILSVIADAAVKTLSPTIYGNLSTSSLRGRLRFVGLSYAALPVWLMCAVVLWLILKLFGGLILGSQFLGAIDLSLLFLLGNALFATYLNIAATFFFTGKTGSISIASVAATVFTALIAAPLVSWLGLYGGGLTYIFAQGIMLVAAFVLSVKVMPMPWDNPRLAFRVLFHAARS